MVTGNRRSITSFFTNLQAPMPLGHKIRLLLRNNWVKINLNFGGKDEKKRNDSRGDNSAIFPYRDIFLSPDAGRNGLSLEYQR